MDRKDKISHLIVMFNGLDEILPHHMGLYDRFAAEVCEHGVAAVLLPTPFHLNRAAYIPTNGITDANLEEHADASQPTMRLQNCPHLIYKNFSQSLAEVELLIHKIRGNGTTARYYSREEKCFYEDLFEKETKICLFGYSLGGLRAIAASLVHRDEIECCFPVSSGGKLSERGLPSTTCALSKGP